jgi:pSer/pThr/pTyr-binding forkhead associated (FHA) protein
MKLQELEARLRTLIEVHLIKALPGQRPEDLLVQRLTDAMQAGAVADVNGERVAPNVYTLLANPGRSASWKNPELVDTLVDILQATAEQNNIRFDSAPSITLADDSTLAPGAFQIIASFRTDSLAETKNLHESTDSESSEPESTSVPENAYLIIEGVKVFPLTSGVVNIGRRLDNTLVVDDPRVSRNHAQLRAIKGRYVLFDLNSTGGTFVNGQRANQTVLYPGDVISLAGVSLIFGQDNPVARSDVSPTSPRSNTGADRSTAVIHSLPPTPKKEK